MTLVQSPYCSTNSICTLDTDQIGNVRPSGAYVVWRIQSMTELALLASIHANLDDDYARLIYADWLDEHDVDHARAEFIRLQVAFARPERQNFLLAQNIHNWWKTNASSPRFRRGFPWQITVDPLVAFRWSRNPRQLSNRVLGIFRDNPTLERLRLFDYSPVEAINENGEAIGFYWRHSTAGLHIPGSLPTFVLKYVDKVYETQAAAIEALTITLGQLARKVAFE